MSPKLAIRIRIAAFVAASMMGRKAGTLWNQPDLDRVDRGADHAICRKGPTPNDPHVPCRR
jgi:hypothetical protein